MSLKRFLKPLWLFSSSGELLVLLPLLIVIGGGWAFIELSEAVREGSTQQFDDWGIRMMRSSAERLGAGTTTHAAPDGPRWLEEIGRDITALGGFAVLTLVIVISAGFLWLQNSRHMMWLLIAAAGGGLLLSSGLKYVISRPRPGLVPHLSMVYTTSFPSGHSMLSAVVYLSLGTLLARSVAGRASKIYCIVVAAFFPFIIGISRIYMGVHYPTDVLAGWTAGVAWALVCWTVSAYLQRLGKVEPPVETVHLPAASVAPPDGSTA